MLFQLIWGKITPNPAHLLECLPFSFKLLFSEYLCCLISFQLLQSFKIMDYSLLVGIHNLDQARREQVRQQAVARAADQRRPQGQKSLYSTAIEAIQAEAGSGGSAETEDKWVTKCLWPWRDGMAQIGVTEGDDGALNDATFYRTGGIPARNSKGERLLVYIGIIDIMQSYR